MADTGHGGRRGHCESTLDASGTPSVNSAVICYIIIRGGVSLLCGSSINIALRSEAGTWTFAFIRLCHSVCPTAVWIYTSVWMTAASVGISGLHPECSPPQARRAFQHLLPGWWWRFRWCSLDGGRASLGSGLEVIQPHLFLSLPLLQASVSGVISPFPLSPPCQLPAARPPRMDFYPLDLQTKLNLSSISCVESWCFIISTEE